MPPRECAVEGCTRMGGRHGLLCRMHYDRQHRGTPLDAPLDPRAALKAARHGGRSHRTALRELAVRLEVLGVVADQSHAHEFVAYLAAYWPATDLFEDGEWLQIVEPMGDPSMFGL